MDQGQPTISAVLDLICLVLGLCTKWVPSMKPTSVLLAGRSLFAAMTARLANGFSPSTCLPLLGRSHADFLPDTGWCGDVDRVDTVPGKHVGPGVEGFGDLVSALANFFRGSPSSCWRRPPARHWMPAEILGAMELAIPPVPTTPQRSVLPALPAAWPVSRRGPRC